MPTYDYKCKECGYDFEHFQSMTEKPLTNCPLCNGKVERLIGTGGALIFKGSGFYTTDYRSDSYKKAKKADKPASTVKDSTKKSSSDSSKKTDVKK